jgi:CheY-like chemotaxis protein
MSEHQAVLYVEDEAIIREFLVMALEDAGFEVVAAENGAAALEALDHNADPFCAIVTDIQLGAGPDGWEVARRARQINRQLPVVYMTGAGGADMAAKGVSNSLMIAKPFNFDDVVQAVIALIGKAA